MGYGNLFAKGTGQGESKIQLRGYVVWICANVNDPSPQALAFVRKPSDVPTDGTQRLLKHSLPVALKRFTEENVYMKRLWLIGFAACAFALAPSLAASAMPVATPGTLVVSEEAVIQVKGGHGHHYGWGRGRGHHYGWRHHRF
jgi:hypothetical protein